ncbi:MAG: RNA methyltransferase [Solobacterium sp.]|nr:RNA methyltransferase [Solobacterium sp.]
MKQIDSLSNQYIKDWTRLHQKKERDRTGRFLAEGEHLVQEALKAGIVEVLITDRPEGYGFFEEILVPKKILDKLSQNVSGAHVIAVCRIKEPQASKTDRILILDGVQDPGNLGTLIRTAVSFGYDRIVCSKETCDLYNDKVIRSTQGALFQIPIERRELSSYVEQLKQEGITMIATSLYNAVPLQEVEKPERFAIILGNEGNGVRDQLIQLADVSVRIEMNGFESLNVAVAGGIMMYEMEKHA